MKQLFIIRHGKSDWGNPFQDDFDRPLNHRGLIDAKKMGSYLSNYTHPQKIISSTAKRAITTAYLIGDQLKINCELISLKRKRFGKVRGEATVDGQLVCSGELMFSLVD